MVMHNLSLELSIILSEVQQLRCYSTIALDYDETIRKYYLFRSDIPDSRRVKDGRRK